MRIRLPNGVERPLFGKVSKVGETVWTPDLGDLRITGFEGEVAVAEPVGPPPVRRAKPWVRAPRPAGSGVA